MHEIVISITEDGNTRCLVSPDTECFLSDDSTIRRASNVEPTNVPLRIIFYTLRLCFGEYGRVANFTRHWHCLWRVNLAPIGGPVLPERWADRQAAIDSEIQWLQRYWI